MNKPLVSYVLTAYNIEAYINEAIDCAFAQNYSPLQIVLSDDCSTDETYVIMEKRVKEYEGPHKIVLNRNTQNMGITRHMNKAYLELANGEIIIAAHGDDISTADRTNISVDFLLKHPECTAVSTSMIGFSLNKQKMKYHSVIVQRTVYYSFKEEGNVPAASRAFYRRVMTLFGPLNDDCPTEDELITFRALMLGKNAILPNVCVKYRKHDTSSSNAANFDKFPLELISKQKVDDMRKAVAKGWISENEMQEKTSFFLIAEKKRMIYRNYLTNRTFVNLIRVIKSRNIYSLRTWYAMLKIHFSNEF